MYPTFVQLYMVAMTTAELPWNHWRSIGDHMFPTGCDRLEWPREVAWRTLFNFSCGPPQHITA